MKKEFKKYPRKNDHRSFVKWMMIIFLLIITLVATGFFIYHYKKPISMSRVLSHQVVKIQLWLTERKNGLQKKLGEVSEVAANKTENKQDIHFEFYTTLPTMKIKPQEGKKITSLKNGVKLFDASKLENALQKEIHK